MLARFKSTGQFLFGFVGMLMHLLGVSAFQLLGCFCMSLSCVLESPVKVCSCPSNISIVVIKSFLEILLVSMLEFILRLIRAITELIRLLVMLLLQ